MQIPSTPLFRWRRALALALPLALGAALVHVPGADAQPGATRAQGAPEVNSQLAAYRVTQSDNKELLAPAQNARPGDIIEYRVSFSNSGKGAAMNLRPVLPVPAGTVYIANSAAPASFEASLDGQNFASAPLLRKVKKADGTTQTVAVPLSEYRALRWNAGTLAPGEINSFKARVQISKAK